MSKSFKNDLRGQRFGRLTVLEFVPTEGYRSYWKCVCDCGKEKIVASNNLQSGSTTSCGCTAREICSIRGHIIGTNNSTHGKSQTKIYRVWKSMRARCYNVKATSYPRYGGRGITVCDEWNLSFETFYQWAISNGYEEGLSIDRINANGNYEPSNCRWVGTKEQSRNKRNTIMLEYENRVISLAEAAELSGIKYATLRHRYYAGLRGEELFRPPQEHKKVK